MTTVAIADEHAVKNQPRLNTTGGLSPEEWLVVFPRSLDPAPDVGDSRHPLTDPAESLRAEFPLTNDSILRVVSNDLLLLNFTRANLVLGPWASRSALRICCFFVIYLGLTASLWGFNDGRLGTKQLAAATASAVIRLIAYGILFPYFAFLASKSIFNKTGPGGVQKTPDLSFWPNATLWRYLQLSAGTTTNFILERGSKLTSPQSNETSVIFKHLDNDEFCSCPRDSCAGSLPTQSGRLQALVTVLCIALGCFYDIAFIYTPLVTFGSSIWANWVMLFGILAILAIINDIVVSCLGGAALANTVAIGDLERRLHHRVVSNALATLVRYFDTMVVEKKEEPPGDKAEEEYAELLPFIFAKWKANKNFSVLILAVTSFFMGEAVCIVLNVALGSCVTAGTLGLLAMGFYALLLELVNTSVVNSGTDEISALWISTSRSLKRLLLEVERDPVLQATNIKAQIASHDAFLLSFADTSPYKARIFGVQVTMGLVRTLVVTAFTVGLGLWSILRGSGVYVTMESVCPMYY